MNVTVHGLFVGNYVPTHQTEFLDEMAGWIQDGLVKYREDVWRGLEQTPAAFSALLSGGNFGKTLVQVGDDPTAPDESSDRFARGNVLAP